jgi:hypothetical protein
MEISAAHVRFLGAVRARRAVEEKQHYRNYCALQIQGCWKRSGALCLALIDNITTRVATATMLDAQISDMQ